LDLSFYYYYVDDIILAASADKAMHILNIFNSFNDRLQFTIEFEDGRCISFLNILLSVKDKNEIIID